MRSLQRFDATRQGRWERRGGGTLVFVAMLVLGVSALSLSLVTAVNASRREVSGSREDIGALYLCEAGVSAAVADLTTGGEGNVGTKQQPIGHGSGAYYVSAVDLGGGRIQLQSTGGDEHATLRAEVVIERAAGGPFQWGAFGDEDLVMDSNAMVDSYDAEVDTYVAQAINGGVQPYANDDGDIGSNASIAMSSNTVVYGNAEPGPTSSVALMNNATVTGSTAPSTELFTMPGIVVPSFPLLGPYAVTGVNSLASGDYYYDQFEVKGTLTIVGPARIVVDDFLLSANSQIEVDATNGPVEFWVYNDFQLKSNTLVASQTFMPRDIRINLLSNNIINPSVEVTLAEVTFNSNSMLFGTIYAPNAEVEIDSNFQLFGSLVARRVDLDSNSMIHYDESLARTSSGRAAAWDTLLWRLLPLN